MLLFVILITEIKPELLAVIANYWRKNKKTVSMSPELSPVFILMTYKPHIMRCYVLQLEGCFIQPKTYPKPRKLKGLAGFFVPRDSHKRALKP